MELSKRLQAVADLVPDCPDQTVVDVGCDHGYIPIYLVEHKRCKKAIAMDVNQGPLEKAREHILSYHLEAYIEYRLSDGLQALDQEEADTVIIAGMGGGLVMKILNQDQRLWRSIHTFILQPQSELAKVRAYLTNHGFQTVAENMVLEDGKYYPMMKVVYDACASQSETDMGKETYDEVELEYGRLLIREKHPVLKQYIEREIELKRAVLASLDDKAGSHIETRIVELTDEIRRAEDALCRYH